MRIEGADAMWLFLTFTMCFLNTKHPPFAVWRTSSSFGCIILSCCVHSVLSGEGVYAWWFVTSPTRDKTRVARRHVWLLLTTDMAAVGFCGDWFIFSCDKKLVAIHTRESREPFVFDCSTAETRPKNTQDHNNSDGCASEETGNDRVITFTVSPSGKLLALTDDTKRLVLFHFVEPQKEGELKMGHLSMLLAVDGTVKLWEFESGQRLQSWDLRELEDTQSSDPDNKKPTVSHMACSPDGRNIAVQCERLSTVQFFTLQQGRENRLVPHSRLSLPHCPLDVTFDPEGRLWVLMDDDDAPLQCEAVCPELNTVNKAFRPHWEALEASTRSSSSSEHLYKSSFDNVAVYLQKKQQRLEDQQLKRTMTHQAKNNKKKNGKCL
ncbi:hypothetical protein INR49_030001 [Caranx melampygus]|nr:hypothetical protein INR49_030001 [Caranx melampygus]